jgi:alpha-tubulin suppressor-like RCC1 family protein
LKFLKLNLLSRRLVLLLTVGAMGATAWSSSAPNGRIAILGTEVVILGPDDGVSIGSEFHRRDDLSGVLRIATGARHAAALEVDGSVWTWGENDMGQLGGGPETGRLRAEPLRPLAGISGLACGADHCVAWRVDGRTWTWGRNDHGQLGDGSIRNSAAPTEIRLPPVRSAAGGRDHTLAVTLDSRVLAWGANGAGQLGRPGVDESAEPVLVDGLSRIVDVSAGDEHSLALGC